MNKGMQRLLEKYDYMIEEIHREYNICDGHNGSDYWIYLKEGYISPSTDCSCIHEYTLKDCEDELRGVIKNV